MVKKKCDFFKDKNLLKIAAWSGVALVVLGIIITILTFILLKKEKILGLMIYFSIFSTIISILFIYGLIILGKRYKNKLLQIMGYLFIVYYILGFSMNMLGYTGLGGNIFDEDFIPSEEEMEQLSEEEREEVILKLFRSIGFLFLIFGLPHMILSILLGIAILKLRKKGVKHAKVTGILDIVGGATIILLGIGYLILFIANIFKIIILFNESKKR